MAHIEWVGVPAKAQGVGVLPQAQQVAVPHKAQEGSSTHWKGEFYIIKGPF